MFEYKDSKRIRNITRKTSGELTPLHTKFEDILLLVTSFVNTYLGLSKALNVPYRTIKDRVDFLVQRELLIRGKGKRNIPFYLTKTGNMYIKIYLSHVADSFKLGVTLTPSQCGKNHPSFLKNRHLVRETNVADFQSLEKSVLISRRGHKITPKTPKIDKFPFNNLRFREYCEEILTSLPADYPQDPILLIRAHWITYKFPILQQDKRYERMTLFGENERGPLDLQTWTCVPMKNWYKYQGTLFYLKIPFKCIFTTKNVVIQFQTIFTNEPLESAGRILKYIYFAKKTIEDYFSTNKTKFFLGNINPDFVAFCILQHYGILLHPLAFICDALGITIEDTKGRLRIDASKGTPELETIHSWFALDDIDFLFNDIVFQVKNHFGVQEAYQEIQIMKEETANLQSHCIKAENQYLVLADQITLTNKRINTYESEIIIVEKYLAQLAQLLHEEAYSRISQIESLEDRASSIERTLESYHFKKRSKIEHAIINFLRKNHYRRYTRKELSQKLDQKLGSVSPTISKLVKMGVILEDKEDNKAGRYFINSSYLNQMKSNSVINNIK